ncbi:MAG: CoA transferase [Proteobacteria bacterium]|nr:CoA transferase [Pseudomonadota bacterium]
MNTAQENKGPLKGVRVFDMSRILAGPSATQILGDLGADILKIEKPGAGDDTRKWGPPFLKDKTGDDTSESSYYLSANRNKKSFTLDFTQPDGLKIAKRMLDKCDILFENYKPGTLEKHGLGYEQLKKEFPRLIYCSLTGFGHTGPYRDQGGYDYMIQGMGGMMSLNGPVEGHPYKLPIALTDIMTGLYSLTGILAALYYREKTGQGQFIDIALLDTQVAVLSNAAQYYLTGGQVPPRMGNAHLTIVPYEVFKAADGYIILAVGNDRQYRDFCISAGRPELYQNAGYTENKNRVKNRKILVPIISEIIAQHPVQYWLSELEKLGVPCGPVNTLDQVFADPQVKARNMAMKMKHSGTTEPITLIANPLFLSETPVSYRHAPPTLGGDTLDILKTELQMNDDDISQLKQKGVV